MPGNGWGCAVPKFDGIFLPKELFNVHFSLNAKYVQKPHKIIFDIASKLW
jgi:hypothetical protein